MATVPTERTETATSTYSTDAPAVYEMGEGSAPDPAATDDPLSHHKDRQFKRPTEPDRIAPEPERDQDAPNTKRGR